MTRFLHVARTSRYVTMAAANPICVSSSPSRSIILTTPPRGPLATMSSSPNLPSPSRLFMKKPTSFLTDSHAVSLPIDALAGFTSASTLLLHAHASDHAVDDSNEPRNELGESTNLQKRAEKPVKSKKLSVGKGGSGVSITKKTRAPKKIPAESGKNEAGMKEQPHTNHESESRGLQDSDKKRAKKSKGEAQTKIGNSNITKPGALNKKMKSVASIKKLKNGVQAVAQASVKEFERIYPLGEEPLDLGLIEAIKRRKAWTPIKDTLQEDSRS